MRKQKRKDKLFTALVAAVCVGVPVLAAWGALVVLGKIVVALGWW